MKVILKQMTRVRGILCHLVEVKICLVFSILGTPRTKLNDWVYKESNQTNVQ